MIESKILGSAVGIQRGDVIDKSETTVLPSLANGVITGCFKRGRMDKPFKVTASNYQALLGHDPSNPSYLAVEDAFKLGVSEISILRVGSSVMASSCVPTPSAWSNPISFEMVNRPTSNGGIQVNFGDYVPDTESLNISTWINLANKTTIEEFFADINIETSYNNPCILGVKSHGDGTASIRLEANPTNPINADAATSTAYAAQRAPEFYVYDSSNIGNNAEAQLYLSNAFTGDVITFLSCDYPQDNSGDV